MRHGNKNKDLSVSKKRRVAITRGLIKSMIMHGRIRTTETRAKVLQGAIEQMITRSKEDTVANRRLISARLGNDQKAVKRLFETIAPKFKERHGGYTRIAKLAKRGGSSRSEAIIDFVS